MKLPKDYFEKEENIIYTYPDDEWDLKVGEYLIIKDVKIKVAWCNEKKITVNTLFWTAYDANVLGAFVVSGNSGWTMCESVSRYKTTKRKLPEGGRWAIVKEYK